MRILFYNNCWFTNVGEAFIDFGAICLLKKIFPQSSIACISEMTTLYATSSPCVGNMEVSDNDILERCFDPNGFFDADYLVFPGMFACKGFVDDCKAKRMASMMKNNGTKIVFLGMGGEKYDEEEIFACSKYFETLKPELIITRDNTTYENYRNVAECMKGIDCAFWVSDMYNPRGFAKEKYDVVSFNRSKEPEIFKNWELPIIRPWHRQFTYKKNYFSEGRMISDTAFDYLTIYANANRVYTDLVHATIPALIYGVPVKYWYIDQRSLAFGAVDNLNNENGWLSVKPEFLEKQKEKIVSETLRRLKLIG